MTILPLWLTEVGSTLSTVAIRAFSVSLALTVGVGVGVVLHVRVLVVLIVATSLVTMLGCSGAGLSAILSTYVLFSS